MMQPKQQKGRDNQIITIINIENPPNPDLSSKLN